MSIQQAEAFVTRVQEDPEFAERLAALNDDPTAVQALVVAEGFDATPEEIRDAFLEAFGSELTEEQLAAIAGGIDPSILMADYRNRPSDGVIGASVLIGTGAVASAAAAAG